MSVSGVLQVRYLGYCQQTRHGSVQTAPMKQPSSPYDMAQCRYGTMLINRFDYYIGQALLRYGEYCEHEVELLRFFIAEPGTVVEIGGNNGSQTVALAQAARAVGGDLVVFEPQPFLFQNLCANLALNALDNVSAWNFACASEPGTLSFEKPDYHHLGNFGGVSLSRTQGSNTVQVPCVRLDDWVRDRPVRLMKIDVEGFEMEVLRGAAETIEVNQPVIYMENDRLDQSAALIRYLWQLDYQLWWHVTPLFNEANFRGERENIYPRPYSYNMLCIPRRLEMDIRGLPEIVDADRHPMPDKRMKTI